MKYFLIAGEASGDLHAAHLMRALREADADAEFRFFGGDKMQAEGGTLLCHYKELAYMGFIPVLLHLRTILRGMAACKRAIADWRPDSVILVDYPGFNLSIARYVREQALCPVYYYISPKIWAWKEGRIKRIRRDVTHLYSILPFEVDFFEKKHNYPITYVGNPTVDEVSAFLAQNAPSEDAKRAGERTIALLPGSRLQEIRDNLSRMLEASRPFIADGYKLVIAQAPAISADVYEALIASAGISAACASLVKGRTYELLSTARAALVTSGTATLETALFRVPQVVCYFMSFGRLVSLVRPYFLKVPFISLVNLIAGREVVPELVAGDMTAENARRHLSALLSDDSPERIAQLQGYAELAKRLGAPGAPSRAAADIVRRLLENKIRS